MSNPIAALTKKGFKVIEETKENSFIEMLPKVDVAWIISGTDPSPMTKTATSSGESYPAWKTSTKSNFQTAVLQFHNTGGGLLIWGDNDPLFEHANAVLEQLFKESKVVLIGNTPGNKILSIGESAQTQKFGRHMITTGIVNLYEGVTICYPSELGKLKVLATSSDGHPVCCYADNEVLPVNCGRVVVDCGYTKNYISWDEAGTSRYIINATVWLLGIEHKLRHGSPVSRTKGK